MQVIERTNVFSKIYDILGFSNFICLPQTIQYISFILTFLESIKKDLVLFYHCLQKLLPPNFLK